MILWDLYQGFFEHVGTPRNLLVEKTSSPFKLPCSHGSTKISEVFRLLFLLFSRIRLKELRNRQTCENHSEMIWNCENMYTTIPTVPLFG